MNIGLLAIQEIASTVNDLLVKRLAELQQAYMAAEDPFAISITAKIKPVSEGNRIDLSVGFVTGKVKDSAVRIVNEDQMSLGFKESAS